MAVQEFINTHQVFNIDDLKQGHVLSATDSNLLSRATSKGKIDRVRRGLFVSKTGRYEGVAPDPFEIANASVDDAVFCYLSALQLHGVLHNIVFKTQFYTKHRLPSFSYNNHEFTPLHVRQDFELQSVLTKQGKRYSVTSREQTLIDCLNKTALAGGVENLLRSMGGFTYLDFDKLEKLVSNASQSTCARLGWLLESNKETWSVPDNALLNLHAKISKGPYCFHSSSEPKDSNWVSGWRLYLPHPEQEMVAWLRQ
jgi:predicted transcriptional regulator of viral defense system